MRVVLTATLLSAALFLSGHAEAGQLTIKALENVNPLPSGPPQIGPETRVYTQADIPTDFNAEEYPPRALEAEVEGSVIINCEVGPDDRLTRCVIEHESPIDYGFGEATVFVFLKYARLKPGIQQPGEWKRFTYRWQLG